MAATADALAAATTTTTANLNWSITIGAGSNRLLLVFVNLAAHSAGFEGTLAATATKGGADTAMTSGAIVHANASNAGFIQCFWIATPDTGTCNIKVTRTGGSGTQDLIGYARSYSGAGTPVFTTASGSSALASVTFTIASGDIAVTGACAGNSFTANTDTLLTGAGQNVNTLSGAGNQRVAEKTGASGSTTMTDTITASDFWGSIGVQVAAAAGAAARTNVRGGNRAAILRTSTY